MRSTVSKRGVRGAKRFNPNEWKGMLAKSEMVTSLGVVRKFSGEESHFEISDENGDAEILVDVELIPTGERALCRLGFGNDGVYRIPRVNTEVAVLIPYNPQSLIKDALDYGGIIVAVLDNNAPSQLDDDDIVIIKAPRVHIFNNGSAESLATKADLQALTDYINNDMVLPVSGASAGPLPTPPAPDPAGTTILKAE